MSVFHQYERHPAITNLRTQPKQGQPGPVGQLASDRLAGGRQHVRRLDNWHGAHHPARPGLGRFQPAGRAPCPTVHPPPHPYRHRRLDDWHPSSATVDLGARLGLDHRRKPVIGRQPRACLVHDGQHDDGPSRAPVAGPGVGLQRFGRFSGAVRCDSDS